MKQPTYEEFWNERGDIPADEWSPIKQNKVRDFLYSIDYDSVLEVGCGEGQFSRLILEKMPRNAEGIDLNKHRVDQSPYATTFLDNFLTHNYNGVKFDLVCCSHVLLHIKYDDYKGFYEKMKSLALKYIVLIEPDMYQYSSLNWARMNHHHDYRNLDDFKEIDVESRVVLFHKEI